MEGAGCVIVLLVVIGISIAVLVANANALKNAREKYQRHLAMLKKQPHNADLKEETLRLGRVYSNLTRKKKGVALYDEVALMNDISAATAGAGAPAAAPLPPVPTSPTSEERLRNLARLKEQGLLSEEEYQERRGRILDEL